MALTRADGAAHAEQLRASLRVQFPVPLEALITETVFPKLPAAIEALLMSTDLAATPDYRPLFAAAQYLEVAEVVSIGPGGPTVTLPARVQRWRDDPTLRIFIETCHLCGISQTQIAEDLRRMYGLDVDEGELAFFINYFVDREYTKGGLWLLYERCIGPDESQFKRQLMAQPHDFVRWKLGVPVHLESDRVLDRLISDSYFTERLIKFQSGDATALGRDEVARIKLERDTIFKALDRRLKHQQSRGEGDGANTAAQAISRIVLEYRDQVPQTRDQLGQTDIETDEAASTGMPLITDLEKTDDGNGVGEAG